MEPIIEELLFNLSCVGSDECLAHGEWLYYINSENLSADGDGKVWKIKKDGTENQLVQKSESAVFALVAIDERWIYFLGKSNNADVLSVLGSSLFSEFRRTEHLKMTVRGSLERPMSEEDEENYEDTILAMEEY